MQKNICLVLIQPEINKIFQVLLQAICLRFAYTFLFCSCRVTPSKEMQAALKVINDSLSKNQHLATTLKNANKIVQKEWFRISSTENASPFDVEDYLDCFEEYSPNLLKYIVNLNDANVITHGIFIFFA